jgi:diguanylate cyclase (GGDEF)-like protein/PAS domain S-box-containing protein
MDEVLIKPRILVVNDVPVNLLTLGAALKDDFDLQIATSGEMGLALARELPPDLILLDIMMPGIDGYETCRRLKQDPRLKDVPVVFVTALTEVDSEIRGLELGALDYITKPIQVETARRRIHNLLERESLRKQVQAQRDELAVEVAARTAAQERLQLAASVFASAREAIVITDLTGTIVEVNDAFSFITGYARQEAVGQHTRMLKSDRHSADFYQAMWAQLLSKGHWYGEIWNRRKNGELYAAMSHVNVVLSAQGKPKNYVALFSDITTMKEHERELEHIAHYDLLTGLPNRALLADRLRQAMLQAQRRKQQVAVVFLDLDGFKSVNDQHGHEAGDQLLVAIARRMKAVLREGDTLARLGGDEFVAVLVDLDDGAAPMPLLERLLEAAATEVQIGQISLGVTASLGVTFYPQDQDMDADQLMRQADQAMYQAKLAGKNRYRLFDTTQDSGLRSRHALVEQVRHALGHGQMVLHYQPKVNMRTGEVLGAEALVRWMHPEQGLLLPNAFLPAVEDTPLSVDLGRWVIDTALAQMQAWRQMGLNLPVSVNVSARQLAQADFVAQIQSALSHCPLVLPSDLELEVLESSALKDIVHVSRVIEQCRALGVSFALDDFGTGYATLNYLKMLPVNTLKIDRSFVRDILSDPDDRSLTEAIVRLGEVFHRQLVAEGVETTEQAEMLIGLGCDVAQGFGISRPMLGGDMPYWVTHYAPTGAWRHWMDAA